MCSVLASEVLAFWLRADVVRACHPAVMLPICLKHFLNTPAAPHAAAAFLFRGCRRANYCSLANMEGCRENIEGINISYVRVGSGPNVVLCLPGALGSAWTDFKPQLEMLDKKQFTLVAWDPPGYGLSRPPDRDFTGDFLHRDADIALKLMKALKLPKFSMLGWSDGGITAMILAGRHPLHVKKCVIWGANAFVLREELEMYHKIRDISTWSEKMRAPMVKLYGEEYFRKMWEDWVDAFDRIYQAFNGNICLDELKLIQCPLFVLHGDKDPMVSRVHVDHILTMVSNCRVHRFPNGKHNIHLRYPEEFNKLVTEFLLTFVPGGSYMRIQGEPK